MDRASWTAQDVEAPIQLSNNADARHHSSEIDRLVVRRAATKAVGATAAAAKIVNTCPAVLWVVFPDVAGVPVQHANKGFGLLYGKRISDENNPPFL